VSKLEEGKIDNVMEELDVFEFVTGIVSEMQPLTKPGQRLVYNHDGNKMVCLDKKLLTNIFFNLISNAIKFSPEEKPIVITTKVLSSLINIWVEDKGIGISKADQEHLFERFFRGNNATHIQGTGLGLNIVAKYVELMKGRIDFESKENEGTTFNITIPL
jgi:signal transduction histidine kinase